MIDCQPHSNTTPLQHGKPLSSDGRKRQQRLKLHIHESDITGGKGDFLEYLSVLLDALCDVTDNI